MCVWYAIHMTTITIPKNLIAEEDLMVIPRLEYQRILHYAVIDEGHEHLWQTATKDVFVKSYSKSDDIYDQV